MEILVNVIGQKLKIATNLKCFISGSQQFVKFTFNMDDSWDNLQTFAQFRQNDVAYNQYLDANNSVYLPREIGAGTCTLILYGTGGNVRATTNYLTLTIDENILVTNAQSTEITQSLYEQLVNSVTTTTNRLQDRVANVENVIQGLAGGAPIVVSSVSEMTDTEQIYILSTDGMWYYHNGTAWVSGGEYGAVATDTTLTQSGAPADAKVVGDEIADLKADLDDLDDRVEALEQGDGGTIVEKTVSGGAVVTVTDGAAGYPLKALTAEIATPSSGSAPSYAGANLYRSGADTSNPTVVPISWETEAGAVCGGTLEINSDGSADLTVSWGKITISDIRVGDINKSTGYGNLTLWFIKWYYLTNKKKVGLNNVFSPQWTLDSSGVSANLADLSMACSTGTTYNYVYFRDDRCTTVSEFFNAHKNDVLIYEYAEPVVYHLTSVDSIETIAGLNKIWTNIGNITSLTYSAFVEEGEISVDPTLSKEGDAADAAATGEAIGAVDTKVEAIRTAAASDVGKTLKAKTITSGKVTEWEFGTVESNAFGDPAEFSTGFYWHRAIVGTSTESQLNKSTNAVGKCAKVTLPKGSVLRITSTEPNSDTLSRIYFAYNASTGICIDVPTKNADDAYATYYLRYDVDSNVYINTKASNAVFACVADVTNPISDMANLVGISQQTVMELNGGEDAISYALKSMKRKQYKATNTPTVFLHFSDIHGDGENLKRIVEFANESVVSAQIDDVICSGDVVFFTLTDGMEYYDSIDGAEDILIAVGNHDTVVRDGSNPVATTPQNTYNTIFANKISGWGVTQPSNAATDGLAYYYKDYADNNLRVIFVDSVSRSLAADYLTDELTWFEGVLADAITEGLSVACVEHYPFKKNTYSYVSCSFSPRYNFDIADGAGTIPETFITAVEDFIDDGGEFVAWIAGHGHQDYVLQHNTARQLCIGVSCAIHNGYNVQYGDELREEYKKSQDLFNLMAIDTVSKNISIMRVGADMTRLMNSKKHLCIDYENRTVIWND